MPNGVGQRSPVTVLVELDDDVLVEVPEVVGTDIVMVDVLDEVDPDIVIVTVLVEVDMPDVMEVLLLMPLVMELLVL